MKKPFISVVVPNYNYARYLEQRIESIINQTYPNFEIILLDDKSTDDSVEIINKYRDHERITKIIINEDNSGSPFIQWEKGIREAKGDIIWIAESDDFCAPNFLEVLVDKHTVNNSVVTFCKSRLVDEDGNTLRENNQMAGEHEDVVLPGKQFISTYLAFSNVVQNASCAIFNKSVALSVDKGYMNFKGAGDWLFWIELAEMGNVCYVNKELNSYRLHNNTTSKVVKSGMEFHEMKSIYERLRDKGLLTEKKFKRCRFNNLLLIKSLNEIPQEVKSDLYKMWGLKFLDRVNFLRFKLKSLLYRYFILTIRG